MQPFADGDKDGEPDVFHYNVNGLSGSFSFYKSGSTVSIIQKTKSNVKIDYTAGTPISSFTITDTNGMVYTFSEQEKMESYSPSPTPPATTKEPVTSWYLSTIKDHKGNTLLTFTYHSLSNLEYTTYGPRSELTGTAAFTSADMTYTDHTVTAKRIKEISYPGGKVKFNLSSGTRQDYKNDKYLDNVEIYDGEDDRIKQFVFGYSYFDATGTSAIGVNPSGILYNSRDVGDYKKRLKLDQVQEKSGDLSTTLPATTFTYNTTNYLPSRYSFAQDHWGFYNGETSNTSPEPKYRLKYYNVTGPANYVEFGTADREADATYAKAGVLEKVTYPSGGYTEFEMEGNTAVSNDLPNSTTPKSYTLPVNNSDVNFDVNLINEDFAILRFSGTVQRFNISAEIREQGTNVLVDSFTIPKRSTGSSHDTTVVLQQDGDFYVSLQYSGTSYSAPESLQLTYTNEVSTTNKPVGGLRVKSITDHDGISTANDVTRNFYYNESGSTGNSTGRVVNAPKYGYQRVQNTSITGIDMKPMGFIRSMRSTYPLMSTNGSFVGYSKVTVMVDDGSELGKTEYEFTTADTYPDFHDGYYRASLSGDSFFDLGDLGTHETYPYPQIDSRDFMRGLLTKQTDYRWTGSTYEKVKEVENDHVLTFDLPQTNGESITTPPPWDKVSVNTSHEFAKGITFYKKLWSHYKQYNIYAGRMDLEKSTTKVYNSSGSLFLETESTNHWDDLSSDYFGVSRVTTKDSEGNTRETKYFYPYNRASLTGLTTAQSDALSAMDTVKNMISAVIHQEQYLGTTKLSMVRNNHAAFNGQYLPSIVETAKGSNSLESRVRYHSYDDYGNPRELSQEDGTRIVYLWGYDNTLPVAQIQNATYSAVSALITQSVLDDPTDEAALLSELNTLRSHSSMTGALVTTMTYTPGLGMTTQVDPNGLQTTYHYDSFGRLHMIKDDDGNIIQTYKYHYKGEGN